MRETVRRTVLAAGLVSQALLLGWNFEGFGLFLLQIPFSLWVLAPFALYYRLSKNRGSDELVALSGTLLVGLHVFFLYVYFGSRNSTTAIMFVFTPVYELLPLAVLYLPPGRAAIGSVLACVIVGIGAVHGVQKLTKEAADPATPAARLEAISTGGWGGLPGVKQALAGNPAAPPALLERLAADGGEYILRDIGHNPSADPALLARIAQHKDYTSLWGVSRNPKTPVDSLRLLAGRGAEDTGGAMEWKLYQSFVLTGIASNPSTPCSILEQLAAGEGTSRDLARRVSKERCK